MLVLDAHPILNHRSRNEWNLEPRSLTGGVSLSGDEQVIAGPMGRWRAEIRIGNLSPAQRREIAPFLGRLRGRVNGLRIRPNCCPPDSLFARLGIAVPSAAERASGLPHDDDAFFADDVGYDGAEIAPMALAAPVAAFAREILLDEGDYARGLAVSDWLGLGGRLFRIAGVFPEEAVYRVEIEPGVRLALAAGGSVDLNPAAVMRLAADAGGFVGVDYDSPAPLTLSLVEHPALG